MVGLEKLSGDERREVLAAQGMSAGEAEVFLREAAERGLAEFLENPQNLIMLMNAVRTGSWPSSRKQLFELSTELLLSEFSHEHSRTGGGVYSVDELRGTAGAICAVRLISDVAGISLAESENNPDYPSYRTLGFLELAKVQAALGRRVFAATPFPETVDYAHRTTAEFLGAAWLAGQMRGGLPLGRVRALLGIDGHPASELRGLHAWLSVFSPENAEVLIDADPYGVLTYGDAGSLSPSARRHLLTVLGGLSESDPWFRSGSWNAPAVGALAQPDMVEPFRSVLRSPDANFALRSIVVDAVALGHPLPALQGELVGVLVRDASPYAERFHALDALERLGPDGKEAIATAYRERLGTGASTLRLRAEIVARLYGEYYGTDDVATLMAETPACDEEVPTGTLWAVSSRVPLGDIPAVLNRFEPLERRLRSRFERINVWEAARAVKRLILRIWSAPEGTVDPADALKWLRVLRAFRDSYGSSEATLRETLRRNPALLRRMADVFLETVPVDANRWLSYFEFHELTAQAIDPEQLLEWIAAYLRRTPQGGDRELFLYEVALRLCGSPSPRTQTIFAELFAWGETRADLRTVRDAALATEIPEWRRARSARRDRQEQADTDRRTLREKFAASAAAIRSGAHLGWLTVAAKFYFGLFGDVDQRTTPHERLVTGLGEANAQAAIEGFIAVLQRPNSPTLAEVVTLSGGRQHYEWWRVIIAGLDERWQQVPGLAGLSDQLLQVALAFELVNPTFERDETTARRRHAWKDAVFEGRPELARDAYLAIARELAAGRGNCERTPGAAERRCISAVPEGRPAGIPAGLPQCASNATRGGLAKRARLAGRPSGIARAGPECYRGRDHRRYAAVQSVARRSLFRFATRIRHPSGKRGAGSARACVALARSLGL